jgi:hypothetical protein
MHAMRLKRYVVRDLKYGQTLGYNAYAVHSRHGKREMQINEQTLSASIPRQTPDCAQPGVFSP